MVPRLEIPRRDDPATVWYDPSTGKAIAKLGSPGWLSLTLLGAACAVARTLFSGTAVGVDRCYR
jgi:hypothetical protein